MTSVKIRNRMLYNLHCAHGGPIRHVLKVPVSLACGHYICSDCVYSNHRNNDDDEDGCEDDEDRKVYCRFCESAHKKLEIWPSKIALSSLKQNRNDLFKIIFERYSNEYEDLKSNSKFLYE
jgi:hypothetical protein